MTATGLTPFEEFENDVQGLLADLGDLLCSKQRDYGPAAISQSPGGAVNGLRVRIHDKTSRLSHLLDTAADPNHESIRDNVVDLINYHVILLMVLDGTWPGTEKEA